MLRTALSFLEQDLYLSKMAESSATRIFPAASLVRAAQTASKFDARQLAALAEALLIDPQIIAAVLRRIAGQSSSHLAKSRDLARLVFVLACTPELTAASTIGSRLDGIARGLPPPEIEHLERLARLHGLEVLHISDRVPDDDGETPAEKRLEDAYKAQDWLRARIALIDLTGNRHSETRIVRAAEALVACGEFREALKWADLSTDPARKARIDYIRARAFLGLGDHQAAWRASLDCPLEKRPAHLVAVAAAALRLGEDLARIPELLPLGESGTVTLNALNSALQDVLDNNPLAGQRAVNDILRRAARAAAANGKIKPVVDQLRFRHGRNGWPARTEARWARHIFEGAIAGRWRADGAIEALLSHHRPRLALEIVENSDVSNASSASILAVAEALALQGDFADPFRLAQSCRDVPGKLKQYLDRLAPDLQKSPYRDDAHAAQRAIYQTLDAMPRERHRVIPTDGPQHVLHVGTTLSMGGTERQLQTVVRALAERHPYLHQTILLARSGLTGDFDRALEDLGARLTFLTPEALDRDHSDGPLTALYPEEYARKATRLPRIERLREIIRTSGAQSALLWRLDAAAFMAARLSGIEHIVVRAASLPAALRPWSSEAQVAVSASFAAAIHALKDRGNIALLANCEAALEAHRAVAGWPAEISSCLYNSIDRAHFDAGMDRIQARASLALPADAVIAGGVFRLSPEKRPSLWLDVAKSCITRDRKGTLHFVLAGDGPMSGKLRNRVAGDDVLRERVHFLGKIEDNIASAYRAFDVLLHTSAVEGLPNTLIEAQAAHCPVVCTDVGGCREAFVPGITGLLCKDDDEQTIVATLEQALQNLGEFQSSKAAAACDELIASRFSTQTNLGKLERLLGFQVSG